MPTLYSRRTFRTLATRSDIIFTFFSLNIRAITRGQVLGEDGSSLELDSSDYARSIGFAITAPKTGTQNFVSWSLTCLVLQV